MVNNQGETPLLHRGLIFTERCQGGKETSCLKLDAVLQPCYRSANLVKDMVLFFM